MPEEYGPEADPQWTREEPGQYRPKILKPEEKTPAAWPPLVLIILAAFFWGQVYSILTAQSSTDAKLTCPPGVPSHFTLMAVYGGTVLATLSILVIRRARGAFSWIVFLLSICICIVLVILQSTIKTLCYPG